MSQQFVAMLIEVRSRTRPDAIVFLPEKVCLDFAETLWMSVGSIEYTFVLDLGGSDWEFEGNV